MKRIAPESSRAVLLFVLAACVGCHLSSSPVPRFGRVTRLELSRGVGAIELNADGKQFLLATRSDLIRRYSEPWGTPREQRIGGTVVAIGLLADGRVFAADGEQFTIWDSALVESTVVRPPAHDPKLPGYRMALSPSGRFIGADDAVYDTSTKSWVFDRVGHGGQKALAFAGDQRVLTAGFHDRRVVVRDLPGGPEHVWRPGAPVVAAVFAQGGAQVMAAAKGKVFAWKPGAGAVAAERELSDVRDVRVCDGDRVAAVLAESSLYLLDFPSLRERARVRLESPGSALACDGALVVAGDQAGEVYAYDLERRQLAARERLIHATVDALSVAFAARRLLAVGNDERGARVELVQVP